MITAEEARKLTDVATDNDAKFKDYIENIDLLIKCGVSRGYYKTCLRVDKDYLTRVEKYVHDLGYRTFYAFDILDIEWGEVLPEAPKKITIFEKINNYFYRKD